VIFHIVEFFPYHRTFSLQLAGAGKGQFAVIDMYSEVFSSDSGEIGIQEDLIVVTSKMISSVVCPKYP
jgi:hypothetical protein